MGEPKIAQESGAQFLDLLLQSPLFHGLDEKALQFVLSKLEKVSVRAGEPVILQNEISDDVFIIEKGSIEIVTFVTELKQVNRLAVLKSGAHFSEFSVLNRTVKSASGFAIEDTDLLKLGGSDFLDILNRFPPVARNIVERLAKMNSSVSESKVFIEYFKPSMIQVNRNILDLFPIAMWKRFGALPLSFESGVFTLAVRTPYNPQLYEQIQNRASQSSVNIFLIEEKQFEKTEIELKQYYLGQKEPPARERKKPKEQKVFEDLLQQNYLFKNLPAQLIQQLLPHFKPIQLKSGEVLFQPGDESQNLYLVESGRMEIAHPVKNSSVYTHVGSLESGEVFSELSLLNKSSHKHLAKALGETVVRSLSGSIFSELLKTPSCLMPLAQRLAERLHEKNKQTGLKYFEDTSQVCFEGLADLIPLSLMKSQKLIPLVCQDNEVTVGLVNPENEEVYSLMSRYLSGFRVSLQMISQEQFNQWVAEIPQYSVREESGVTENSAIRTARVKKQTQVNPVEELNKIFLESLQNRASDIHIEPGESVVSVRYRVDGVLHERSTNIPKELHKEFINRIKILAEMDISMDKTPQDGQLKTKIEEMDFIARVSTIPTKKGEKAVLRVIRSSGATVPLNMIAPDKRVISVLNEITKAKQGLFLVTGPTGSGKSTTLYSLLNEINQVGVNIMTVEDPVEKELSGLNQVQLHNKAGLTFPAALRSFLRQDPDVIMVGEIRDAESAHIVMEAAITGHLVLSTMHTNSSLDTVNRLAEFEISPVTIASAMLGVVSQRLLRAICKSCGEPRATTDFEKEFFAQNLRSVKPPEFLIEGAGCVRCNGSGYSDRIPVFEVWRNTEDLRLCLTKEEQWDHLEDLARRDGFESILEFGLRMVINGLTTIEEVKRCLF